MSKKPRKPIRRGMTLIESVLSLSVISVLLLGLSSAVMLGARAMPTDTELGGFEQEIHAICQQLRADVSNSTGIMHQVSGDNTRLTLTMASSGATGEPASVVYDFIGSVGWLSRRVDAGTTATLTSDMPSYSILYTEVDGVVRFVQINMRFNNSIQQNFQLHIQTPNEPTRS